MRHIWGDVAFTVLRCFGAGVADGVGGWAASGVDAGEYSRLLMQMAQVYAEASRIAPTPIQILQSAYNRTQVWSHDIPACRLNHVTQLSFMQASQIYIGEDCLVTARLSRI